MKDSYFIFFVKLQNQRYFFRSHFILKLTQISGLLLYSTYFGWILNLLPTVPTFGADRYTHDGDELIVAVGMPGIRLRCLYYSFVQIRTNMEATSCTASVFIGQEFSKELHCSLLTTYLHRWIYIHLCQLYATVGIAGATNASQCLHTGFFFCSRKNTKPGTTFLIAV